MKFRSRTVAPLMGRALSHISFVPRLTTVSSLICCMEFEGGGSVEGGGSGEIRGDKPLMNYPDNGFVCERCCFDEEDVVTFVTDNLYNDEDCSYCGCSGAAMLKDVFDMVLDRVREEWYTPEKSKLPMGILKGSNLPISNNSWGLVATVGLSGGDENFVEHCDQYAGSPVWIKRPYNTSHHEALRFGWEEFCRVVKHQRRFFFSDDDPADHSDGIPLSRVLEEVCTAARAANLYRTLPKGCIVYRVRKGEHTDRAELLAPPPEKARFANRMSPAGIPLFYGSFDPKTALAEVYDPGRSKWGDVFTVGKFELTDTVPILNLSELSAPPGLFEEGWETRGAVAFIHEFAKNIAARVKKDGREHIEYVPTQIFAEYLMTAGGKKDKLGGIMFSSAVKEGGKSCVLFPDVGGEWWEENKQENLRLIDVSRRKLNPHWDYVMET